MTAFIKRDLMWTNYLLIDQVKCKSIYIHIERYSIRKFHYLFTILLKSRSFVVTYSYAKKCLIDLKENILKKMCPTNGLYYERIISYNYATFMSIKCGTNKF